MNKKSVMTLVVITIVAIVISAIFSNIIFNPSKKRKANVPEVTSISSTFPDVKNDSTYQPIFNAQALDPTQLIQIGPNQNATPFSSSNP